MGLLLGGISYSRFVCMCVCQFGVFCFMDGMVGAVRVAVLLMGFGFLGYV